jgi:hypothetical protein
VPSSVKQLPVNQQVFTILRHPPPGHSRSVTPFYYSLFSSAEAYARL